MTTCTIFVIACFSCPCFLLSSWTCSFNKFQSLASFAIVTMATSNRDVEGRSEAWRVCFSRGRSLSIAACALFDCEGNRQRVQIHRRLLADTFASFSASGMALLTSGVKSLSAFNTVLSDILALSCGEVRMLAGGRSYHGGGAVERYVVMGKREYWGRWRMLVSRGHISSKLQVVEPTSSCTDALMP